uniref:Uncharacterized protein n=1 Tax=Triticum urartu TaxID=4572 RepID=A0A8R7PTC3_TRIUA
MNLCCTVKIELFTKSYVEAPPSVFHLCVLLRFNLMQTIFV